MKFTKGDLEFKVIDNTTNVTVYKCLNKEIVNIEIPQSIEHNGVNYTITGIGDRSFEYCINLKSINLLNTITHIGSCAFKFCVSLEKINLPNSVKEIGNGAFDNCKSLKNINIHNTITNIANYAFSNCESLEKINIPNSVKEIGVCAFYRTKIDLPKRYTEDNKLIAYKGFDLINNKLVCRDFEYQEGETYTIEGKIQCCERGFHACTNPLHVFNYYFGVIGKHIEIHEVYLGGEIDADNEVDSKVCVSEITIGRNLTIDDINNLINE